MYMPNVAAALISMRYGAKGPNYCTVSACASSAHSVGDALELIRHDQADVMIAGGAEAAITPLAVASFANMKALSERNDEPATANRPLDKDRDRVVLGAAGALEAAVCALVVQRGIIPPTINQFTPDPACDLYSAPNKLVKRPVEVALSNSFGFGGHNVTLAIRRAA